MAFGGFQPNAFQPDFQFQGSLPAAQGGTGIPGGRLLLRPKKLSEIITYPFDFISSLDVGESLLTATASMTVYSGTDLAPFNMLLSSATIKGTAVLQTIGNGVLGVIYEPLITVTTNYGNTIEISGYLIITPDLP
jgi:hypothetical protein